MVDPGLRLSLTAKLVAGAAQVPTWIVTRAAGDAPRAMRFSSARVELIELAPDVDEGMDLAAALRALGGRGLTRILVEGGAGWRGR